jgi:hypothetical protein
MTTSRFDAVLSAWHRLSLRWDFACEITGTGWSLHRNSIAGLQWDVRADGDVPLWARAVTAEVLRRAAAATVDMQRPCTTASALEIERRLAAIMADYQLMTWSAIVRAPLHIQPEAA